MSNYPLRLPETLMEDARNGGCQGRFHRKRRPAAPRIG